MHCGGKLLQHDTTRFTCTQCGYKHYVNPKAAVGVVLRTPQDGRVILARRNAEPYKGALDVIGGFVDNGETIEQAITRELHEEVGLRSDDIQDLEYVTSVYTNYDWMGKDVAIECVIFIASVAPGAKLVPNDDVASIEEYDINGDIPNDFECDWMYPTLTAIKAYLDSH